MVKKKKGKLKGNVTSINTRASEPTKGRHGGPQRPTEANGNEADVVPTNGKQDSKASADSQDSIEEANAPLNQQVEYDSPVVLLKPLLFLVAGVLVILLIKFLLDFLV